MHPEFVLSGPRIALTWSPLATRPADRYIEAVGSSGGVPLLMLPEDGMRELQTIDGLLLTGGRDVHPARYGQDPDPLVAGTLELDPARDQFEQDAIAFALEHDLPILGICRGIQALNVARGGTLLQDISLRGIEIAAHQQRRRSTPLADWEPAHSVRLESGARLTGILGATEVPVNSFHHQVVDEPAPGLRVVARAPDGLVEALEAGDRPFVVGVQWHSERMVGHDPRQQALFAAFIDAAEGARRRRAR